MTHHDHEAAAELSAILITPDRYATLRHTVAALTAQTVRERLELVIVCPDPKTLEPALDELAPFASHRVVGVGDLRSTSRARSAGVEAATAPVVVLMEDHSFPEPGWAEALIARHREDWTGVGPVILNANPTSRASWASLMIEYGDWMDPCEGRPTHHLPGHNSSYKKAALLGYGDRLPDILEAESVMQWDLGTRGHRFYLEPAARTRHTNIDTIRPSISHRFHGGRLFAANRSREWSPGRRLLYVLGSPLIPLVRLARLARHARRVATAHPVPGGVLPVAALLLAVDGFGELLGYALGGGRSMRYLTAEAEFHKDRLLRHARPSP